MLLNILFHIFLTSPSLSPSSLGNRSVFTEEVALCSTVPHVQWPFSTSKNKCQKERDVHLAAITRETCDGPTSAFQAEKKTINMFVLHLHTFFQFLFTSDDYISVNERVDEIVVGPLSNKSFGSISRSVCSDIFWQETVTSRTHFDKQQNWAHSPLKLR